MPRFESYRAMARDAADQIQCEAIDDDQLPNLITLVGRGIPSSFEITTAGDIELAEGNPREEAIVISNGTAEGTIDSGALRFRFSGELANVHVVDWNGVPAPESPSTPTVHIDYNVPER